MRLWIILAGAVALTAAQPALSASSAWHDTEGGRIRLVVAAPPDAGGKLYGALDIDLKPGWKTYWRDPGSAGVPPSIDVSANPDIAGATIDFPAPIHVDDGGAIWAGYDRPVALPVTFDTKAAPHAIDANVFLGICKTICIPVQAMLRVDMSAAASTSQDAAVVLAAAAKLPQAEWPGFEAELVEVSSSTLTIEVHAPGSPESVDLFLAGDAQYMFGSLKRRVEDDKIIFTVEVLTRPDKKATGEGLHYTLTSAARAVSGKIPYF